MALVFVDIDNKHFDKFKAFINSIPNDEAFYVEADDPKDFSDSVQQMILKKIQKEFDLEEDELMEKLKEFSELDDDEFDDIFDDDDDDDIDFETADLYNLLDAAGEVIPFEIESSDIVDYFQEIDSAIFNNDYKYITVNFENGVIASKEFISKRLADYLLSSNTFFYEDAVVIEEISDDVIKKAVIELVERGYIEEVFEFEDYDDDEDDNFEDFSKN